VDDDADDDSNDDHDDDDDDYADLMEKREDRESCLERKREGEERKNIIGVFHASKVGINNYLFWYKIENIDIRSNILKLFWFIINRI